MNDTNVTTIASSVEEFLSCHAIHYDILSHVPTQSLEQAASRLRISPYEFARAVVLSDGDEACMAVLPLNYILDFSALYEITGRNYKPAPVKIIRRIFKDCESGAIPPLGMAYGLKTIVDNSLYRTDNVIFEAGRHNSLVRINRKGFLKLTSQAKHTNFAKPESSLKQDEANGQSDLLTHGDEGASIHDFAPYEKMNALLKDLYEIPALPDNARKLLELRSHPDTSENDLLSMIERETDIAEKLLQYARSPFFAYEGKIDTVKDAISRVLGFDMALSMAVGLCAMKSFQSTSDGPLGLNALWKHSIYSAILAKRLSGMISNEHNLKPDVVYMAALMHNFGLLLFGHLFQSEFFLLNRMVSVNPEIPVVELEHKILAMGRAREVLHIGHSTAGSCLMQKWGMPEEVIIAIREHHNVDYHGPYEEYAKFILIIDRLLKRYHLGDACNISLPKSVMDYLGLDEDQAVSVLEELIEECEDLGDLCEPCLA
ncbi:MAG: HDOD domain-containing protein [Gammaproteobacteria bacterium]|nr:HDOD domain-containing protein [Gammaproteobacteria bacterium]